MMIAFPQLFPQVFPKGLVAMARHHAVPDDTALDRLIIRLIMMKVPKAPFFWRRMQTTGIISACTLSHSVRRSFG